MSSAKKHSGIALIIIIVETKQKSNFFMQNFISYNSKCNVNGVHCCILARNRAS